MSDNRNIVDVIVVGRSGPVFIRFNSQPKDTKEAISCVIFGVEEFIDENSETKTADELAAYIIGAAIGRRLHPSILPKRIESDKIPTIWVDCIDQLISLSFPYETIISTVNFGYVSSGELVHMVRKSAREWHE